MHKARKIICIAGGTLSIITAIPFAQSSPLVSVFLALFGIFLWVIAPFV